MKKMLILLFVGIAFGLPAGFNLTEQGCEESGGVWTCHTPTYLADLPVKFVGDVACFSNNSDYSESACMTAVELQKTVSADDCTYSVGQDRETVYNDCGKVTLAKGTVMFAVIGEEDIGIFSCEKFQEGTVYATYCIANNTEGTFGGYVTVWEQEPSMLVTKMDVPRVDLAAFVLNNILYIILIIAIIVIAYWVFAPHKPMLKEKKIVKKETTHKEETTATKREMRYGRRL
jgi:hypothetical protein